jgi:SpoVK/Ycf46/Vps4 family AAA+-type ATPase
VEGQAGGHLDQPNHLRSGCQLCSPPEAARNGAASSTEELDVPVTMEDFKEAVEECNKNVSNEDLEKYTLKG